MNLFNSTLTASSKVLLAQATLSTSFNETIRRIILDIEHRSDQVSASEAYQFAIGMCVVSDAAIAAGAASIPGPITDADDDLWMYWRSFQGSVTVGAIAGDVVTLAQLEHTESKAMRRIQEGQQLAIMAEAQSTGVAISFGLSIYGTFAT